MTAARREELLAEFYPPIQHGYVRAREIACEALASDAARAEQIERLRAFIAMYEDEMPAYDVRALLSSTDPSRGGE
jgi:hypothetical protein